MITFSHSLTACLIFFGENSLTVGAYDEQFLYGAVVSLPFTDVKAICSKQSAVH